MICPSRLFTRPKAEREDGAAAAALPLEFSPNFFVKSPQKWILRIVGDGARRARPRGERCKALIIHAKKPPNKKEKKKNAKIYLS